MSAAPKASRARNDRLSHAWLALVAIPLLSATLAACTSGNDNPSPQPTNISVYVGKDEDDVIAAKKLRGDLIVQDAAAILGKRADYDFSAGATDNGAWTVVAICADSKNIRTAHSVEVGIVPSEALAKASRSSSLQKKFAESITCIDGRKYRG